MCVDKHSSFSEWVEHLARHYQEDIKIRPILSARCRDCEFVAKEIDKAKGKKSGFHECWMECIDWGEEDFFGGTVLDLWNYRSKDRLINQGCFKLSQVQEIDIKPGGDGRPGLSAKERQWLQVRKEQENDKELWLDKDGLRCEMESWKFPLHFIDFETTMVAIPFNKGRRPYEGIAFQFSHHTLYENGDVVHSHEYLNVTPGEFPNYHFIRQLMHALQGDEGSIFRYSAHENTFLNIIYRQLLADLSTIPDREELLGFIKSITRSTGNPGEEWVGNRDMIDMLEMVKRYYFDPATNGSNSLKYILPSVINRSIKLQEKYSRPIYGGKNGIRSLNYTDWQWVQYKEGKVIDPYRLLPKMFQDIDDHVLDILSESDELREGGAAMTAYGRMQFEEMSNYEREEIRKALLKYCELDTMAMVMLYEGWQDLILS